MTPYAKRALECIALLSKRAQEVYELGNEEVAPEDYGLRAHMKHISASIGVAMLEAFKAEADTTPGHTQEEETEKPDPNKPEDPVPVAPAPKTFPPYIRRIK